MFKKLKKRIIEALNMGTNLDYLEQEIEDNYDKGKLNEDQYKELMSML